MFDLFQERIETALRSITKKGKLTEQDVDQLLRQVRLSLIEADVHFQTVKDFIQRLRPKLLGQEVLESLSPAEHIVRFVYESLVKLLGGEAPPLSFHEKPLRVLLVGLQGVGKTTTAVKLARFFQSEGRRALLLGLDFKRPAAGEQLRKLAAPEGVPVWLPSAGLTTAAWRESFKIHAGEADVVIGDSGGRLHVDEAAMEEMAELKRLLDPQHTWLVVDAQAGQDVVRQGKGFEPVGLTGAIVTKLDGDARGGAVLSLRHATGVPFFFMGVGEKTHQLERFYPERIARRLLGMGDLLTFLERAEAAVDKQKVVAWEKKLKKGDFDLEDFREQLKQVRKMGPLGDLLEMIGLSGAKLPQGSAEQELKRVAAIIDSMTLQERRNPDILNGSRRRRIARGSGTTVQEVNQVLKQYLWAKDWMKALQKGKGVNLAKMLRGFGG